MEVLLLKPHLFPSHSKNVVKPLVFHVSYSRIMSRSLQHLKEGPAILNKNSSKAVCEVPLSEEWPDSNTVRCCPIAVYGKRGSNSPVVAEGECSHPSPVTLASPHIYYWFCCSSYVAQMGSCFQCLWRPQIPNCL